MEMKKLHFDQILPFAQKLLTQAVKQGDTAIDCTMGNGHDTIFLAKLVGKSGYVHAFDIQQDALNNTTERLKSEELSDRVTLHLHSHAHVNECVPKDEHDKITGAIFNLGYLPGGDKAIVTQATSTVQAVGKLLDIMATNAVIVLVIYHGHQEGKFERDTLLQYVATIPREIADVIEYRFLNHQNSPPFIIAIEKKQKH